MAKTIAHDLLQIFKSSVAAVLAENLITKSLSYNPVTDQLKICNENYDVKNKNIYLVGTGKAVQSMAQAVETMLGPKIKSGIISIPMGSKINTVDKQVKYYEGAMHNLPDENALSTAKIVNNLVVSLGENDFLLVLISGGGSALLPFPKQPITLEEKTSLIKKLANSGADIKELNIVRKSLSDLKGGQLAINAQPAQVVSLILSDIVGDPLDLIASGPTVKNDEGVDKTLNIFKKYDLALPESVTKALEDLVICDKFPETVKNYIIGSNTLSIEAATKTASSLNYFPIPLSNIVSGDVSDIAEKYVKLAKIFCYVIKGELDSQNLKSQIDSLKIPGINCPFVDVINENVKEVCLILGGEITVTIKGSGQGGRNQQLALEFSNLIHKNRQDFQGFDVYILSAGTDGIDGPTDAAGAIGYKDLILDSKGLNVDKYLENNDSYNFYKEFSHGKLHVITGHTNTNVMDIHLIAIKKLDM